MAILRDLHNNMLQSLALNVQAISTDTTTNGNEIDMQGYGSLEFVIFTKTITDGDYVVLIEESDTSGSGYTAVADADLTNTEASASFTDDTDDNASSRIGYIGNKRYVRLSIVSTSTSTGVDAIGAVALQGHPNLAPVADPAD